MIVALTGGTGGAKFIQGLAAVMPARDLTVVVNTGDDLTCWGLNVSPDLDSVTYALAGLLSRERGWGVDGDTFRCLETMCRMGAETWFQLGDRDLATHLRRTELLSQDRSLSQVTSEIARALGVETTILPMTDDRVETRVLTPARELSFQEYFVREHYQVPVTGIKFDGAQHALPAPGVLEAIARAEAIVIAPSNPITSIGPILAVQGIREGLRKTAAPIAAISPIIGGSAVSGPAGELMKTQGLPVSIAGVARAYADFLDLVVADSCDRATAFVAEGIDVRYANTLMKSAADKQGLARVVLGFLGEYRAEAAAS